MRVKLGGDRKVQCKTHRRVLYELRTYTTIILRNTITPAQIASRLHLQLFITICWLMMWSHIYTDQTGFMKHTKAELYLQDVFVNFYSIDDSMSLSHRLLKSIFTDHCDQEWSDTTLLPAHWRLVSGQSCCTGIHCHHHHYTLPVPPHTTPLLLSTTTSHYFGIKSNTTYSLLSP